MVRFLSLLMLSSSVLYACATPSGNASDLRNGKTFSGTIRVLDRSNFVADDGAVFNFELVGDSARKAYAKEVGGAGYMEEVCAAIIFAGSDTGRKDDAGRSILAIHSIDKINRFQCAD